MPRKKKKKPRVVYAKISDRILANTIDFVLLLIVGIITNTVLFQNFHIDFTFQFSKSLLLTLKQIPELEPLLVVLVLILSLSFLSIYFLIMWVSAAGQTLGKKIVGIKIVSTSKKEISYFRAILRFFLSVLSLSLFGLGFITAIFDKKNQSWHDKLAGTIVVKE